MGWAKKNFTHTPMECVRSCGVVYCEGKCVMCGDRPHRVKASTTRLSNANVVSVLLLLVWCLVRVLQLNSFWCVWTLWSVVHQFFILIMVWTGMRSFRARTLISRNWNKANWCMIRMTMASPKIAHKSFDTGRGGCVAFPQISFKLAREAHQIPFTSE